MIRVSDVMTGIRYRLKDMTGAAFSDFELVNAVNRAVSYLYAAFGERHISAALREASLEIGEGEGFSALPSDFHNVEKVFYCGGPFRLYNCFWRIAGDRFIAHPGLYRLSYYGLPPRVSSGEDFIDAPASLRLGLESVAASLLGGDSAGAEAAIKRQCDVLVARENPAFEDRGPVQVYGGKL